MPSAIHIRPARADDVESLAALATQLGYPSTSVQIADRLTRLNGVPDHAVLVAEDGTRVVGWVSLAVHHTLESGSWAEIDGLVVDEVFRGRGIGRSLVDFARSWGCERGHARIRVRTNQTRTRTHAFYERCGFNLTKSQRVYDLPLKPPAA